MPWNPTRPRITANLRTIARRSVSRSPISSSMLVRLTGATRAPRVTAALSAALSSAETRPSSASALYTLVSKYALSIPLSLPEGTRGGQLAAPSRSGAGPSSEPVVELIDGRIEA